MKLTSSQQATLQAVAANGGKMDTSPHGSRSGTVHGNSAASLVKRGLLRYTPHIVRGVRLPSFVVELTDDGRKTLEGEVNG